MKSLVLAAFAALSLTAAIAPMANAALPGTPTIVRHSGPFDNTANSLGGRYVGGGG
jgi:formyltetrahydrofolate synthetase